MTVQIDHWDLDIDGIRTHGQTDFVGASTTNRTVSRRYKDKIICLLLLFLQNNKYSTTTMSNNNNNNQRYHNYIDRVLLTGIRIQYGLPT